MFKDIIGRPVNVGDFVAYGVRSGNSGGMGVGRVLQIGKETRKSGNYEWETWAIKVRGFERTNLRAVGMEWRLCRPGTLNTPGRIVKLEESQIPEEVIALYE